MNKAIKIVIILTIIFLGIGLFEIILFSQKKEEKGSNGNNYHFSNEVKEEEGIVIYTNPQLKAAHCLNSICIEDASFYYNKDGGRVEYTIHNQSNDVYEGYLKMIFQEQSLVVAIRKLAPGQSVKSSSYYLGIEIKDKDDFVLQELTEDEKSKIVKP